MFLIPYVLFQSLSRSNTIKSIQYLGAEKIHELEVHFCSGLFSLEVFDVSSFTNLEKIEGIFIPNEHLKTIYVADEKRKKLFENSICINPFLAMPEIKIKTDDRHFSELKLEDSAKG